MELGEIRAFHLKIHREQGIPEETLTDHFDQAALSIDGVEESRYGKRRFFVFTLRFGTCLYLWKIMNPLMGEKGRMTLEEFLR